MLPAVWDLTQPLIVSERNQTLLARYMFLSPSYLLYGIQLNRQWFQKEIKLFLPDICFPQQAICYMGSNSTANGFRKKSNSSCQIYVSLTKLSAIWDPTQPPMVSERNQTLLARYMFRSPSYLRNF